MALMMQYRDGNVFTLAKDGWILLVLSMQEQHEFAELLLAMAHAMKALLRVQFFCSLS